MTTTPTIAVDWYGGDLIDIAVHGTTHQLDMLDAQRAETALASGATRIALGAATVTLTEDDATTLYAHLAAENQRWEAAAEAQEADRYPIAAGW